MEGYNKQASMRRNGKGFLRARVDAKCLLCYLTLNTLEKGSTNNHPCSRRPNNCHRQKSGEFQNLYLASVLEGALRNFLTTKAVSILVCFFKKPLFVNRHGNVVVTGAGEVVIDSAKKKKENQKPHITNHDSRNPLSCAKSVVYKHTLDPTGSCNARVSVGFFV